MRMPYLAVLLFVLLLGPGCSSTGDQRIALDPGEPIERLAAFDRLMSINEANARRMGISVTELRRRDVVCIILATGVELRPGFIIGFEEAMLSARLAGDAIDVRIDSSSASSSVYGSGGCLLMGLSWNEDNPGTGGVHEDEAAARAYLDEVATAWTTLGGSVSLKARDPQD